MGLGGLRELVMNREAWCAAVIGVQRVGHDWVTELNWTERLRTSASLFKGYVPFSFSLSSLSFSFSPFPFPSHHCLSLLSLRLLAQDWTWAIIIPVSLEWDISQQIFRTMGSSAYATFFPSHPPHTITFLFSQELFQEDPRVIFVNGVDIIDVIPALG